MTFTVSIIALAFAATTTAQYYNVSSEPFRLVLSSSDAEINGQYLAACHTGAAIESFCLTESNSTSKPNPIDAATFRFNTSSFQTAPDPALGTPGILTYELPTSPPISESMEFYYDPTTNYALPLLFPGDSNSQMVAFDKDDLLNIEGYVNYKTSPPTSGDYKAYYRWYACLTYFTGYEYEDLVWALGDQAPETPGCVKVDVKREFI